MPKSFLFTHRRYNISPVPTDESLVTDADGNKSTPTSHTKHLYAAILPRSPGRGSEAELQSPGRPQSARISPVDMTTAGGRSAIPEEMYNLLQLAEVSLATSGATEVRSVLERLRSLKTPAAKALDMSVKETASVLDKPLDLSRDPSVTGSPSEVRILTPSPSPTPSESQVALVMGLTKTGSRKKTVQSSEESGADEDDDSCWSPSEPCSKPAKAAKSVDGSGSGDGHECPDCGKRYSTSSNLARHRQTHRSPADQKARRCPHCDKVYVSVPAFSMHVRTHSQGCKCPYCGKAFSRPWLLQGHIRTHTGEKPFSCQICDKAFADKSNLRAHIQTHSNLKPFTCQRCGKAFALKSYLYKHEESSCMKLVNKMAPKDA